LLAIEQGPLLAMPVLRIAIMSLLALTLVACEPARPNASPDGAVREFVEIMRSFNGQDAEAQVLFEMLSERAKANLRTRAERYGAASGKKITPSAMFVPSRLILRFPPQAYSAKIVGRYALVEVMGVSPEHRAQVPCVFEDGAWRVDLVLPELAPMRRRPGADE
jgi:hypothetical protein